MVERKIPMSGLEFIGKIVQNNERDLSGIKLEEGFDFSQERDAVGALKAYLKKHQALYYSPLNLAHSEFHHVNFNLRGAVTNMLADYADFTRASFSGCSFDHSQFRNALFDDIIFTSSANYVVSFPFSDFHSTSFRRACLQKGQFIGSSFQYANFGYAQLAQANFGAADFCNAHGLETTIGLDQIHIGEMQGGRIKVNERERRIIERAKCGQMFEVMNSYTN